jgi:hypothetical protein
VPIFQKKKGYVDKPAAEGVVPVSDAGARDADGNLHMDDSCHGPSWHTRIKNHSRDCFILVDWFGK